MLSILALSAIVLPASAWLHLQQPVGRRAFGEALGAALSGEIPGELAIDGVREVRLPTVRAASVVARTASGREVMELRDVTLELDLLGSLEQRGMLARHASVGGGSLDLTESPDGSPWIERAFDEDETSEPAAAPSPSTPGALLLRFGGIRFEDLDVLAGAGGTTARLSRASGRARIWLRRDADVQMRFWRVRGLLRTSLPVISEATARGLALRIDPSSRSVARFATRLDALGSRLTLAGHAPARDGHSARLCLWTGGAARASLFGIGAELFTANGSDVSFDMRPSEAPPSPRCEEEGS